MMNLDHGFDPVVACSAANAGIFFPLSLNRF